MNPWLIVFVVSVLAFTGTAVFFDVRWLRLPNWLTVSAFAAGLLFHIALGLAENGWRGALQHLLFSLGGFLTGFSILFVMWVCGMGGGGDVKLMGAIGAWLGPVPTLYVFLLSGVFVVVSLLALFFYRSTKKGMRKAFEEAKNANQDPPGGNPKKKRKRQMQPYAVSAGLATWTVVIVCAVAATKSTQYWHPRSAPSVDSTASTSS